MTLLSFASTVIKRTAALRYPLQCKYCTIKRTNRTYCTAVTTKLTKPIHDVKTNVANDVILFKYENPKFFKYMNIFAVVQYMVWAYLGAFSFTSLRDAPVDQSKITKDTPWFRKINLGENKYRNALGTIAVIVGVGTVSVIWMYTLKSVRFLILNKGGKQVTFVTYSPFGKNRMMTVPLEAVCCKEARNMARVQLPLKVKDKWMHYMLDMRGEFKNPALFDNTAGLYRKL